MPMSALVMCFSVHPAPASHAAQLTSAFLHAEPRVLYSLPDKACRIFAHGPSWPVRAILTICGMGDILEYHDQSHGQHRRQHKPLGPGPVHTRALEWPGQQSHIDLSGLMI